MGDLIRLNNSYVYLVIFFSMVFVWNISFKMGIHIAVSEKIASGNTLKIMPYNCLRVKG